MTGAGGRAFDILLAAGVGALLLPLVIALAILVRLSSAGPALFSQERVGKNGRRFHLLKLRSMRVVASGARVTAADDVRVTPVGRWLRWTKLDELPQLWNVLRGDMSWVGPRPELPELVETDDEAWRRVLCVRPGLVDPATLAFRREEEMLRGAADPAKLYREQILPRKLRLSRRYLDRATWCSDVGLLLRTPCAIVRGRPAPQLRARVVR